MQMASTMSSFSGTSLPGVQRRVGRASRQTSVRTNAFFSFLKNKDKKEVERFKDSDVKKAKKLLPYDEEWSNSQPKRGFNQDAARNTPREGGFGQGLPYQKVKIGQKMEGTPVPSDISPILFAGGLAVVTIVLSLILVNSQG